jgi:hypothetical protein
VSTSLEGGIRARFIRTALLERVRFIVEQQGWLDAGRRHGEITVLDEPVPADEEIKRNTLSVFIDSIDDEPSEIGSNATDDVHAGFVDFYAESEAVGVQLIGDVRAGLLGKLPAIGCVTPRLPVYDWPEATPDLLFWCEIEDMRRDRATDFREPYRRHWFSLSFSIIDEAVG